MCTEELLPALHSPLRSYRSPDTSPRRTGNLSKTYLRLLRCVAPVDSSDPVLSFVASGCGIAVFTFLERFVGYSQSWRGLFVKFVVVEVVGGTVINNLCLIFGLVGCGCGGTALSAISH
jgi:hypothetical protein